MSMQGPSNEEVFLEFQNTISEFYHALRCCEYDSECGLNIDSTITRLTGKLLRWLNENQIHALDLSNNQFQRLYPDISTTELQGYLNIILNNAQCPITHLNLSKTDQKHFLPIVALISNATHLKFIDLRFNGIADSQALMILDKLPRNLELDLRGNSITNNTNFVEKVQALSLKVHCDFIVKTPFSTSFKEVSAMHMSFAPKIVENPRQFLSAPTRPAFLPLGNVKLRNTHTPPIRNLHTTILRGLKAIL